MNEGMYLSPHVQRVPEEYGGFQWACRPVLSVDSLDGRSILTVERWIDVSAAARGLPFFPTTAARGLPCVGPYPVTTYAAVPVNVVEELCW